MNERGLTIGAVIAELSEEFPELSLSKVRFLDAQGVVSPARTPSGYRRYSKRDVDRLRFVLRCQRDRFWPLKVIKDALDAYDRGLTPAQDSARPVVPEGQQDPDLPTVQSIAAPVAELRLTADEVCQAAGIDAATLADLQAYGLLAPEAEGHYSAHAAQVATAAAALLAGGIQARHLRPFRLAADREVGLVSQLSYGQDEETQARVVRECLALHLALVRASLSQD